MSDTVMSPEAKPLPPRQQRFVEEYVLDLNATQAAIRAGMQVLSSSGVPPGYYVYGLVSPVTDKLFYVGKGLGRRWLAHYREETGSKGNDGKRAEIVLGNREPRCVVLADGLAEPEAFAIEGAFIRALPGLTNLAPGQRSDDERQRDAARAVLLEMESWPPEERGPLYGRCVDELKAIIAGKRPTGAVLRSVNGGPSVRVA